MTKAKSTKKAADEDVGVEDASVESGPKVISEEQLRAAFEKWVPTLHRTVLGRTSGAIKAVERSLPELAKLINEE